VISDSQIPRDAGTHREHSQKIDAVSPQARSQTAVSDSAVNNFRPAEGADREEDAQIVALLGSMNELLFEFLPDGTVVNIWTSNSDFLIAPRSAIIGKKIADFFEAGQARAFEEVFARVMLTGKGEYMEYVIRLPKGNTNALVRVTRMPARNGKPETIWMLARDVTAQKRAEERDSALTARILQCLDDERRHTARHLHDTTVQNLVGLKMNLTRLLRADGAANAQLQGVLSESVDLAEETIQQVRTLSYLLYPPILDEAGLEPAVRWYAKGFQNRSGVLTHVDIPEDIGRFARDIETAIFRIVQESLGDVHRHSSSQVAYVRLWRSGPDVVLEVEDHGRGIGASSDPRHETAPPGIGIAAMAERVRQLAGRFSVSSESGKGTTIRVTLPAGQPAATHAAAAGAGG